MASHNKISVDVTITGDGLKKLNEYTGSFDSLRQSINSLSNPLNAFSNNLNSLDKNLSKYTETLSQLNTENKKLNDTGQQVDEKFNKTLSIFSSGASIVSAFGTKLELLTGSLTGGLSVLIAFLPEIANFVSALFKGKDAIDKAKLSLDLLNKGLLSSDYSKAIENFTNLNVKVDLAKKGFISKAEVVKEYNETLGKTIGRVRTLDQVEMSLKNNAADYIRVMLYKASAMAAIKESADNQILAEKERAKSDEESSDYWDSGLKNSNDPEVKKIYQERARKNREAAALPFAQKAHEAQEIAKKFLEKAAVLERNNPINKLKKQIEDLQKLSGADIVNSKIYNQIKKLKFELNSLDPSYANGEPISYQPKEFKQKPKKTPEKTFTAQPQINDVPAFINPFEKQRKAHEKELALLKKQFDDNLIAEDEYNKKREELEEKYQNGVTTNVKKIVFDDEPLKQLIDKSAELRREIEKDEKGTKSILPWEQHNAEKKLIEDKYAYEILQAKGNADKIKELETQKLLDMNALNERYEQQKKEFALNTAQQVADKAFSIIGNNIKASSDAKIKGLEKDKAAELNNKNLTESQRKAIEDKYQKKENQEKVKAFKAEQKMQVAQAIINGALAVTKATAQTGVFSPLVIPGIIASTAMQIATIVAQKAPAFDRGGRFISDGRGALLSGYSRTDDTNAYLRSGEAVVVSEAMRNPWARNLVSAINVAHGGRDFSVQNSTRGYAIGGIFTDGGNANRYYNQPVNDAKELANTLAYQMINNFPPIYVDVKDVNNQQGILAQTVNRVNL